MLTLTRLDAMKLASEYAIKIRFQNRMSNSRAALEGAAYAWKNGQFDLYHDAAFRTYFEEGKDIGNSKVLSSIAEECGLDPDDFSMALREKYFSEDIDMFLNDANRVLIQAVPTFLHDNRRLIGIQNKEMMKSFMKSGVENERS